MSGNGSSGSVQCVDPNCDHEIGDPNRLSAFLEAGRHADEDHGNEVRWFRGEGGWTLQYVDTDTDQ